MINLRLLRKVLEAHIDWEEVNAGKYPTKGISSRISRRITIKRKKKMVMEHTPNGKVRTIRKNIIKIEIIE